MKQGIYIIEDQRTGDVQGTVTNVALAKPEPEGDANPQRVTFFNTLGSMYHEVNVVSLYDDGAGHVLINTPNGSMKLRWPTMVDYKNLAEEPWLDGDQTFQTYLAEAVANGSDEDAQGALLSVIQTGQM